MTNADFTRTSPDSPAFRRGLPGRCYADAQIFADARSGIFQSAWQFIGHISQLQEIGDYVAADSAAGGIFAMRGDDGKLRAFFNVCRHRGHPLVDGTGTQKRHRLSLSFVELRPAGTTLRGAQNLDKVKSVRKEDIRLGQARLEVFCGFVFANANADAAPMDSVYPQSRRRHSRRMSGN